MSINFFFFSEVREEKLDAYPCWPAASKGWVEVILQLVSVVSNNQLRAQQYMIAVIVPLHTSYLSPNIYNFSTWQMWRNLKFLHIWHVCDVENVSTYVKFILFCFTICFFSRFTLFCCKICFVAIHAVLCGENWTKNCICGEKITNMRCVPLV